MSQELVEKIKRFASVNQRRRKLEAEEKELKAWFRAQAKDKDKIFKAAGWLVKGLWRDRAGYEVGASRYYEVTVDKESKSSA